MIKAYSLKSLIVCLFLVLVACDHPLDKDTTGNCTDGIQNQYEQGVDCGGPCLSCANCEDGVQNGGETGIDCGGACLSCAPTCTPPLGKISYTIHPIEFSSPVDASQSINSSGSIFNNRIEFSVGAGLSSVFNAVNVSLYENLDLKALINVNQTAVFVTTDNSFSSISKKNQVYVEIRGSINFSSYNQVLTRNQQVFITRISNTKFELQFCESNAGSDKFLFRASFNVI